MDINKIREAFERDWGQVDAEQGVYFIPELNSYGSELYAQHEYAQRKSSAWFYFQKGWKASREALVVELPKGDSLARRMFGPQACAANPLISRFDAVEAIEAVGLKVKP